MMAAPLYKACMEGQIWMVETILNNKVQVNIANKQACMYSVISKL